ncbi:MAG: DUF5011 domain-containing protein [Bacilli bacterium]|nr:DUF5011 domain-containing protein [Bacilli bacterium]
MKKISNQLRWILIIICALGLIFLIIVNPMMIFHDNETKLKKAAQRYFELNPNQLPTGERIKTVTLVDLYHQSYVNGNIYIPYSNKTCSLEDSWVKVKKVDGEYKYYTYLKCGMFSSNIDHKGPEIKLNGSKSMQLSKDETFTDPGIKSVTDKTDGKIDISKVEVKSNVDTSKVGTYEVSYTISDSFNNKTVVKREVTVVQVLYNTIKNDLQGAKNYKGNPENNYIRLSNMLFRIYGIDEKDNIIVVSDEDVSYISYTKIDKWLEYYYKNLNEGTKKLIVESKYCNETLAADHLDTTTCSSYTKDRKVYVPSISMINNAMEEDVNFMKAYGLSWTANTKDKDMSYLVSELFYAINPLYSYIDRDNSANCGIRPIMTIKGKTLITGGNGTERNPYTVGDVEKAKAGALVNDRYTGEYISIEGDVYRIVETEKDGTTRVIANFTIGRDDEVTCTASGDKEVIVYDPKDSTSVAYFINNKATAYINMDYFVNHEIEVPIYKDKMIYGEEKETKKYKVKLSAPNMYEMFSAVTKDGTMNPYWLINSSKAKRRTGVIGNNDPYEEEVTKYKTAYVRVVGYLKKGTKISTGEGTLENPYTVK